MSTKGVLTAKLVKTSIIARVHKNSVLSQGFFMTLHAGLHRPIQQVMLGEWIVTAFFLYYLRF